MKLYTRFAQMHFTKLLSVAVYSMTAQRGRPTSPSFSSSLIPLSHVFIFSPRVREKCLSLFLFLTYCRFFCNCMQSCSLQWDHFFSEAVQMFAAKIQRIESFTAVQILLPFINDLIFKTV